MKIPYFIIDQLIGKVKAAEQAIALGGELVLQL
jgi:hypothetical protein